MDDFASMNQVYEKRESTQRCLAVYVTKYLVFTVLPTPKPARTCIQAAKLPNDVDVEIEAIAAT